METTEGDNASADFALCLAHDLISISYSFIRPENNCRYPVSTGCYHYYDQVIVSELYVSPFCKASEPKVDGSPPPRKGNGYKTT